LLSVPSHAVTSPYKESFRPLDSWFCAVAGDRSNRPGHLRKIRERWTKNKLDEAESVFEVDQQTWKHQSPMHAAECTGRLIKNVFLLTWIYYCINNNIITARKMTFSSHQILRFDTDASLFCYWLELWDMWIIWNVNHMKWLTFNNQMNTKQTLVYLRQLAAVCRALNIAMMSVIFIYFCFYCSLRSDKLFNKRISMNEWMSVISYHAFISRAMMISDYWSM
jgi:hypothetical protein